MNKLLFSLVLLYATTAFSETWNLFDGFQPNWRKSWQERKFTSNPTIYSVIQEDHTSVLKGVSTKSASGLWRLLDIQPVKKGTVSWSWKVEHSLASNIHENEKQGDDYVARVFVVFEPHFLKWRTRSICYVWAGQHSVGSIYPSPFASNVGMIVLETGEKHAGEWMSESRDFVADYKRFFGEPPKRVSAVAIMIDTDNTGGNAKSYFRNFVLIAETQSTQSSATH